MTKIDKNNIKRIYNYSLRSIAAFCSARKDLKTLCLKLLKSNFQAALLQDES